MIWISTQKLDQFYQFGLKMNFREPQSINCRKVYSSFKMTQQPDSTCDGNSPYCILLNSSSKNIHSCLIFFVLVFFSSQNIFD